MVSHHAAERDIETWQVIRETCINTFLFILQPHSDAVTLWELRATVLVMLFRPGLVFPKIFLSLVEGISRESPRRGATPAFHFDKAGGQISSDPRMKLFIYQQMNVKNTKGNENKNFDHFLRLKEQVHQENRRQKRSYLLSIHWIAIVLIAHGHTNPAGIGWQCRNPNLIIKIYLSKNRDSVTVHFHTSGSAADITTKLWENFNDRVVYSNHKPAFK